MNARIEENAVKLGLFLHRAATSKPVSWLLLVTFFWTVAAASFSGFINKWGLMGDAGEPFEQKRYGLPLMLEATAHKPFVYRQLAPAVANFAERIAPEKVKEYALGRILTDREFSRAISAPSQELRFRYIIIYYLSFLSLFLSLFILRQALVHFGVASLVATVSPAAFVLALPYIQTVGGFFYDSIELFFTSAAFLLAARGKIIPLFLITFVATLNKETFIFFLPSLYPLLHAKLSTKVALVATSLNILAAGAINIVIKLAYLDSPRGSVAELHVFDNIKYYLKPSNYLYFSELTYGLIGPERFFIGSILLTLIIVVRGWIPAPMKVRLHLLIVAALNFPLVFVFCAPGELRNLSLVYVGLVMMIGFTINRSFTRTAS